MIFKSDEKIEGFSVVFDSDAGRFLALNDDGNAFARSIDIDRLRDSLIKRVQEKKPKFNRRKILSIDSDGIIKEGEATSVCDDGRVWVSFSTGRELVDNNSRWGRKVFADCPENIEIVDKIRTLRLQESALSGRCDELWRSLVLADFSAAAAPDAALDEDKKDK